MRVNDVYQCMRWDGVFRHLKLIVNNCTSVAIISVLFLVAEQGFGQFLPPPIPKKSDPKKITIHSNDNQIIDGSVDPPIQYLNGNVKIFHSNTFMFCDSAIIRGNLLRMYGNVSLLQNDTIRIFADSIFYNGDMLRAFLFNRVYLENGNNKALFSSYLEYDVQQKIGMYPTNAKLIDGDNTLISKRGKYFLNEKKAVFYNNVEITGKENFRLVTDSISYQTDIEKTNFLAPVYIRSDSSELYSNTGWFDIKNEIGDFYGNAQYRKGNTNALADTISYNGLEKMIHLKSAGLSQYISDTDTAFAKRILYDRSNELFTLIDSSWYHNKNNDVKGNVIFFDKKSDLFKVSGRATIMDGANIIQGDTVNYDKLAKFGKANGHVFWQDTSSKVAVKSDLLEFKGEQNYLLAHNFNGRPMFLSFSDADTLFMKADTLKSKKEITPRVRILSEGEKYALSDDTLNIKYIVQKDSFAFNDHPERFASIPDSLLSKVEIFGDTILYPVIDTTLKFYGLHDVRILKSDLQATCDSLVFNQSDSIFILYKQPFVWSDSSQLNGDTISVFIKNGKVDMLDVTSNALALNSTDLQFFNQLSGRKLISLFDNGKMSKMSVFGNAQMVYYLQDNKKAYIGVNTTEASRITFYFENNKIIHTKEYIEPRSKVFPMQKVNHNNLKLKGFIWNDENRPKSKLDL